MSTTATQQFKAEALGQATEPQEFAVEKERVIAYAEATNDDIPQHAAGEVAPPVFAVVPPFESLVPAMGEVIPPELLMNGVHGEQDFRFHKPIRPGMTLVSTAQATGFKGRSSGVTVTVKAETRDKGSGELVTEQWMTSFIRGAQDDREVGEQAAPHAFPEELRGTEPLSEISESFDKDQTFRYSPASGDPMPVHLDDDFAKAVGLPGIIIHGLCTMAFTSRAVIKTACPDDPTRLKRLAVRFAKPCLPEQTITTRIWKSGDGIYVFETTNDAGDIVIKDGLAEIEEA